MRTDVPETPERSASNKIYPPDAFGEELSATGRVWNVYRDEATQHDQRLLAGWNETLDILLIFAGLFSAVATAFIVQSYSMLQPDWSEYTARLLYSAISPNFGSENLTLPVLTVANTAQLSPDIFTPSACSRWMLGIWVYSLSLSLTVAFLAILGKQWLGQYDLRTTSPIPTVQQWCRRRALYYDGLKRWHLPILFAALPALLHASLFLFLLGLILLFWRLDRAIAYGLLIVSAPAVLFYTSAGFLTSFHVECPFYIPPMKPLHAFLHYIRHRRPQASTFKWPDEIESRKDYLDAHILAWMVTASSSRGVAETALYAIGAIDPSSTILAVLPTCGAAIWDDLYGAFSRAHSALISRFSDLLKAKQVSPNSSVVLDYQRLGWSIVTAASFLGSTPNASEDVAAVRHYLMSLLSDRPVALGQEISALIDLYRSLVARPIDERSRLAVNISMDRCDFGSTTPVSPVHAVHLLQALCDYEQEGHWQLPQSLSRVLVLLHFSMVQYGAVAVLQGCVNHLRTLCSLHRVPGIPTGQNIMAYDGAVLHASLALYSHILSSLPQYDLQEDTSMRHFLHADLSLILCALSDADVGQLPAIAQITQLLANEVFPDLQWDANALALLSTLVDAEVTPPIDVASAIHNITQAALALDTNDGPLFWLRPLICDNAPYSLVVLSTYEGGPSVWRRLCRKWVQSPSDDVPSTGMQWWMARELLDCMIFLSAQLRREVPLDLGGKVPALAGELFAVECLYPVVRALFHAHSNACDPEISQPVYSWVQSAYDNDWRPLLRALLTRDLPDLSPSAWLSIKRRLLSAGNIPQHLESLIAEVDIRLTGT